MTIARYRTFDRKTLDQHVRTGSPFIVPGFAKDWPACREWTPDYLAAACGLTAVPVSHYPDGVKLARQIKMTVGQYLAAISATPESWNHYYMESVGLSELSDELYRDLRIPVALDDLPARADRVFFGRNTGSCCHIHSHEESVVFQLMGVKRFMLYRPADVRNLYFEPVTADYRRSRISFGAEIDYHRFPRASRLSPINVVLEPGDALYLPVHWAHWTTAEGFTFTLTRFFQAQLWNYRFPSPGIRCLLGRLIQLLRNGK
jgi:hypothetical protein